ncbi:ATPase domain-containing protein [Streptomyces viridochromogenes DSM 40736]|uniref:ATPase domain-containing protein n=1 Tax=Streptomyces viridochromogenes (strain DSM 40736 / JCM 4977 / BCRC 1201 / Tue 494) TaxID=591159 RepID=D9WYV3_STRVT|nr:ATP-binding protein [Streptomyces viridochromogenes]EFL33232.1 ATPase domain-containing protein [Streptomyces viridochromogenes DSM 40736]
MVLDESSRPELWCKAFGQEAFTENCTARDRFKQSLLNMEERAGQLASEIARDLPEFTQHDITHAYALWEIANHIAGPEICLNPAEAYVLGGAILVHDLAMSHAAHQLSGKKLRQRREWPDALAKEVREKWGRPPHPLELASPPEDLAVEADKQLLRALHAEIAEDLPLASWETLDGSTAYLMGDLELRQAYGRIIGRVAASHHWSTDEVTKILSSPVGAPAFAPIDWRADTLVTALLLRTADAAHLDATRVPSILAAVRNLSSFSKEHWLFQTRVQRPYLKNGRLVFTAPDGFASDEMGAWWLAYETLSMVDEELRNTDSVLSDNRRPTFSARGVANVESPKAFSAVTPCRDWEPVEAKVKVGDVAGLVRRLGGNELYGENWIVGLREIATNACDAVKARESLAAYRGGRPFMGRVHVWLEKKEEKIWLACSDNGIGMSPAILGGKLLDFGNTSWLSSDVVRENPGLLASNFEPAGRFGIGFFSIFMMGKEVQVTSRSISGGPSDTWVLEFSHGVEHRPILRKGSHEEELDEPGTTIKVRLDETLCEAVSTAAEGRVLLRTRISRMAWRVNERVSLVTLLRYLMPASEIDIWASDHIGGEEAQCAVSKQDWMTMDGAKLMRRMFALPEDGLTDFPESANQDDPWDGKGFAEDIAFDVGERLQVVHDAEGKPVGRIAVINPELMDDDLSYPTASIVTAGPARTDTELRQVAGLLIGRPHGAAREFAVPMASYSSMGDWVESQKEQVTRLEFDAADGWPIAIAEMAWKFGRDASDLRCWRVKDGWIDYRALVRWVEKRTSFRVADPINFRVEIGGESFFADLDEDVLVFDLSRSFYISGKGATMYWPQAPEVSDDRPFVSVFGRALEEAWGVPAGSSHQFFKRSRIEYVAAGRFQDRPIVATTYPISRAS